MTETKPSEEAGDRISRTLDEIKAALNIVAAQQAEATARQRQNLARLAELEHVLAVIPIDVLAYYVALSMQPQPVQRSSATDRAADCWKGPRDPSRTARAGGALLN